MSNKKYLVVLIAALFLCSCATAGGPLVQKEGRTGVAKMGRVEFTFPGDFEVVGERAGFGSQTYNQDLVILRKQRGSVDTVIILSYQKLVPSSRFKVADPNVFSRGGAFSEKFVAYGVGPLSTAATYVKEAPVERRGVSKRMFCKVFTGFMTFISTRYRVDILQNFSPEPDPGSATLTQKQLEDLQHFHQYSMDFVKKNLRERTYTEWFSGKIAALKSGGGG